MLRDGYDFRLKSNYLEQPSTGGLAQAFLLGEDFIGNDACKMVPGDIILYGSMFFESEVVNDLEKFKEKSQYILANRYTTDWMM